MSEYSLRHPITATALQGRLAGTTFINYSLMKDESKHSANPCWICVGLGLICNPNQKVFLKMHSWHQSQNVRAEASSFAEIKN